MRLRNILIAIFIVSVLGLLYVQYQYLRVGLNLAAVQFDEKMAEVVVDTEEGLHHENKLSFLIGKAITGDDSYFSLPLDSVQDASRHFLDDYLKEVMVRHGVNSSYGFVLRNSDTTTYLRAPGYSGGYEKALSYPVRLQGYLPELTGENLILELQFENLNAYFLSQLRGLILPGVLFLLLIVGVTVWVMKGFLKQRSLLSVTNEFINNLTHELKTPVFSIGLATRLLTEKEDVDKQEVATIIKVQLEKLKGHIERVLELASLEEKGEVLGKSVFDLGEMISEVAGEFEGVASLEGLTFTMHNEAFGVKVNGMRGHLKNAVDTLLDNARKYSKDPRKVTLGCTVKGGKAFIAVADNGVGVAEEEQKKIFHKYYRVSSGDLHNVKGFGLGLHYVKHIAGLHRGRVSLRSTPGEGSEFILQIPVK